MKNVLAVCLFTAATSASAADLLDTWQAARAHDAEFSAAYAAFEAGSSRRDQARALWRPSVSVNVMVGSMTHDTGTKGAHFTAPGFGRSAGAGFDTSVRGGALERYEVTASQPLIDGKRRAQSRQLALSADMASIAWADARQALMLKAAQRYFDVLIATRTVELLRQQQTAAQRTLQESLDRHHIGDVPVTDTYEAAARMEAVKAQVMLAHNDLLIKEAAYADLTGQKPHDLAPLKADGKGGGGFAPSGSMDKWLARAASHNPSLQLQALEQQVAQQEADKHSALASPTLELVGAAGYERLHGSGRYGSASNKTESWMAGIQLGIPLFTGGHRSAKYEEALHLRDKARAQARHVRQQIELRTRAAWLSLNTGSSRLLALTQALSAGRARLDATYLGHSLGERTTLELLDAQNAVTSDSLALLRARSALVLDRLLLAALTGALHESELQWANCALQAAVCPDETPTIGR